MANIKSAKKKAKQSIKHKTANTQQKSKMRTYIKKTRTLTEEGKLDEAKEFLKTAYSVLDKAAKTNLIHKNKAARLKSKLAAELSKKSKA